MVITPTLNNAVRDAYLSIGTLNVKLKMLLASNEVQSIAYEFLVVSW